MRTQHASHIDLPNSIKTHPFAESLDNLDYPSDFLQRGRFPIYKEHLKMLKDKVGDEMAIFGETEGPFTCAANLVGTEDFLKWTFKKPDSVQKVLDVTKEAVIRRDQLGLRPTAWTITSWPNRPRVRRS